MMNPENGGIMALVGGRDYNKSTYNRATDSSRQVGSTMKPYLYYAALENGFTSSSTFISEKTTFPFDNKKLILLIIIMIIMVISLFLWLLLLLILIIFMLLKLIYF